MAGRRWPVGVVGLLVAALMTGCGSTSTPSAGAPASASPADAARAAAQYTSNTPPASAQMPCSDDIRGRVADALNVDSVPAPPSTWADHVYRCTYALPVGPLVLSVTVAPSDAAARADLDAMRRQVAATDVAPGLGQQAYDNDAGTVVAVKDNMVLHVDATALPDDLGNTHERRADFAQVIAASIFNCWNGT